LLSTGFRLNARHFIAAQDLIVTLIEAGIRFDEPDRFARLLGPVLCATEDEQRRFPGLFRTWVPAHEHTLRPSTAPRSVPRRWWKRHSYLLGLSAATTILA